MKPIVSIIIPCYNAAKFLEYTIESVLDQSFKEWEIILINDGSMDNTEEICLKFCVSSKKIKYLFQTNSGVCQARNNGIKISKGEYILCLDADDLISSNFLEETVKLMDSNPDLTIATSSIEFFGRSRGVLNVVSYSLDVLLAENQLVITSLFRRRDFERIGGFNKNMNEGFEDWDFWISILKPNGKVACAKNATFYYRLLNTSRNREITYEKEQRLRYQMWINHKELYGVLFINPVHYTEYKRYAYSLEYKVGYKLLYPIRTFKGWIFKLKMKLGLNN